MKCCATCNCSLPVPDRTDVVQCRAVPPTPLLIPSMQQKFDITSKQVVNQQVMSMQCIFPVLSTTEFCHLWQPKDIVPLDNGGTEH